MTSAEEAQQLLRQGRIREAEHAFQRVLEADPHHVQALNVIALGALRSGQLERARALLERALAATSGDPITHHHLGQVLEAQGNFAAAADAQRRAIELAPELHVARLHLGRSLEQMGRGEEALLAYAAALKGAQDAGRWLNPASTPPALKPLVEHAVVQVRDGRRARFARLFEPLLKAYGRDSLSRVETALRIYLNEEAREYTDPRQQPSFLYFPGLPASAYLPRQLFPWAERLEQATGDIRGELLALLPSAAGRERVFTSEALEEVNLRGLDVAPTWNGYYFYRHGERREENCERCPKTVAALESLPLSRVREHGPEVLYSVFTPGTHLLPHRGVTNTRLVAHLPLMIPEECALNVGGELHQWQEGRLVVFDDTYEHEAWNRSKKTRVVMIFDIWNPYLTEAERAALADLIGAIGDFRHAVEAA
ncbi:MAG TPA: aspartyl/asparaginyl beta-hydroxylase domain-containing protein [Steroidobacteraceae bacterium]|nr:aspartyl/asparaginyl beta-hydroxylase domain-containing protein [Steroidobacteraceae bacterium]